MNSSSAGRLRSAAGFTLVETLVAVLVVSLIMGATFMAMTHAVRLSENARLSTGLNTNLRSSMDFIVRDLIQSGQGLPGTTHRVGVPNGTGATAIKRPVPAAGSTDPAGLTTFTVASSLPAVSVGYQLGINNNDVVTIMASDSLFEGIKVTAASADTSGASVTAVTARPLVVTNGGASNLRTGDLIDVRTATGDVLMTVTAISGQTMTFNVNNTIDVLGLNQFGNTIAGSATLVIGAAPAVANVTLTRVKMISYYLFNDSATDPRYPRLVRRVNGFAPGTVAYGIQNFTLTFDLTNNDLVFKGVNMSNADAVLGTGACTDTVTPANRACSEDWIRKIGVVVAGRSLDQTAQKLYISNTLFSEVAVRSLAFQDRFR